MSPPDSTRREGGGPRPEPAAKRPTIRDVAARAGVSKSLVSLVFAKPESVSPARTKRVMDAADELGFRPNLVARSLAASTANFHAILVGDLRNPVHADLIDEVQVALSGAGEVSILAGAAIARENRQPELDRQTLALLRDLRPKSILVIGSVPNMAALNELPDEWPVIVVSAVAEGLRHAHTVRVDDRAGMRMAIEHLVERGHRSIAHVGGAGGAVSAGRADAYREAMLSFGLEEFIRIEPSGYTYDSGYAATERIAADGAESLPTALTVTNDLAAVGAMAALRDCLPEDMARSVAVTGYDNSFLSRLNRIQLTSVDPDNALIARTAVRLLSEGSSSADSELLIPPTLAIRASSSDPHIRPREGRHGSLDDVDGPRLAE